MKRTIEIRLGETARPLGTLRYDQQGNRESSAVEYAPTWLADYFQIKADTARRILSEVNRAVSTWRTEARRLRMTSTDCEAFEAAFEHRERKAASKICA